MGKDAYWGIHLLMGQKWGKKLPQDSSLSPSVLSSLAARLCFTHINSE
ncbi:hypothetical protein ACS8CT_17180 [Yersinia enterocolitica]